MIITPLARLAVQRLDIPAENANILQILLGNLTFSLLNSNPEDLLKEFAITSLLQFHIIKPTPAERIFYDGGHDDLRNVKTSPAQVQLGRTTVDELACSNVDRSKTLSAGWAKWLNHIQDPML